MGRLDTNPPPQSSDQIPFQAPPQGYPNHHDNSLSPPPPAPASDTYVADNDQNNNHPETTARSFVPQSSPESMPAPESYPPQNPSTYPPQQPAAAYPPQPTPVQFPPQQEPVQFPPQQEPVQFPPPQQNTNAQAYTPQSNSNYAPQPQPMNNVGQQGYQTPMEMGPPNGIPVATIITACLPCITFGQIAEIVDNGQTSCATGGLLYGAIAFIGMPCIMSCSYRTKIRSSYGLMESPGPDSVTHFFCEWCALCQEYRELKARGLDPAIGNLLEALQSVFEIAK
ncbi:plant cadmium resistance 6-like protein [Tanacetum coccineum]